MMPIHNCVSKWCVGSLSINNEEAQMTAKVSTISPHLPHYRQQLQCSKDLHKICGLLFHKQCVVAFSHSGKEIINWLVDHSTNKCVQYLVRLSTILCPCASDGRVDAPILHDYYMQQYEMRLKEW
jgi:hypothetical protein